MTDENQQKSTDIPEPQDLKDEFLKAVQDLPPMPKVLFKIQKLLLDPNSDVEQIAGYIETDQALAAKVLKMANSPFYGMTGKVSTIQHAAIILGFETLSELTTMAGFSAIMGKKMPGYGYDSDDLWKHSLAVALASKMIAEKINPDLANDALTAGLLHDLGKLILDPYVLDQREAFDNLIEDENQTFLIAEKQILGFDHAEIASEICNHWKFPEPLTLAIKYHHNPSLSNGTEMAFILHLADFIAVLSGSGYDLDEILDIEEEGTDKFLSIHQEDVKSIGDAIFESVLKIEEELNIR
jgi:putative nucleotidyltransferase with HDIG domain